MGTYRNGYVPRDRLVLLASGVNTTVGHWEHLLSPRAAALHHALVARAKARTGRTLAMGAGWSAYRPYGQQVTARQIYGNGAAVPGTSSHGGFWEGRDTLAMDYSNWSWVYGGDRAAFYADCRAVDLEPGLIEPRRGYPDEPWHVVCGDPWGPVPAGSGSTNFEEDEMTPEQNAALADVWNKMQRVIQILEAVDVRTGNKQSGNLAIAAERIASLPADVWAHGLKHPLIDAVIPAGDFLRYEPAEHENTRRAVAAVSAGDVDYDRVAAEIAERFPQLDPHAFAVAAADEADRRERERLGS